MLPYKENFKNVGWPLFGMLIFYIVCFFTLCFLKAISTEQEQKLTNEAENNGAILLVNEKIDYVVEYSPLKNLVQNEIIKQAKEYGVNESEALTIASCESGLDRYAVNKTSGAKGIYQFLDSTWTFIKAPGHQFDYKENIHQFMVWYPLHKDWWECKKVLNNKI